MYNTNLLNLLNGHTNIPTKEDPPLVRDRLSKAETPSDVNADVRDSLNFFVSKGYTNLSDDDAKKQYSLLSKTVGQSKAQQLLNSAFLYNQRPEAAKLNPTQRIQSFYSIKSNNPEMQQTLDNIKSLGYGVLPSYEDSVLSGNNKNKGFTTLTDNVLNDQIKKQITRFKDL